MHNPTGFRGFSEMSFQQLLQGLVKWPYALTSTHFINMAVEKKWDSSSEIIFSVPHCHFTRHLLYWYAVHTVLSWGYFCSILVLNYYDNFASEAQWEEDFPNCMQPLQCPFNITHLQNVTEDSVFGGIPNWTESLSLKFICIQS